MLRTAALAVIPFVASIAAHAQDAHVQKVDVRQQDGRIEVVVTADAPPTFQSTARKSPPEIVVDLLDTDAQPASKKLDKGVLRGWQVEKTAHGARLTLRLQEAVLYDVTAAGNTVTTTLFVAPETQPTAKLAMNDRKSDVRVDGVMGKALAQAEGPAPQRQMTYIGFRNSDKDSVVFARLNAEAKYEVKKEGENLIVLEIRNATIPLRNNKNHLDTTFFDSPVKMITPTEIEDATPTIRIIIEMKEMVPYEAKVQGRDIVVTFKKG
jgi:hypothetical protein